MMSDHLLQLAKSNRIADSAVEMLLDAEETRTAIDGALALADLVARHEIVHSQSFHQLVVFLHDAAEAMRRIGDQGDREARGSTPAAGSRCRQATVSGH